MALPANFRRLVCLSIPIISALAFFGVIESLTETGLKDNLWSSGVTLGIIFGLMQLPLWWMILKRRIP